MPLDQQAALTNTWLIWVIIPQVSRRTWKADDATLNIDLYLYEWTPHGGKETCTFLLFLKWCYSCKTRKKKKNRTKNQRTGRGTYHAVLRVKGSVMNLKISTSRDSLVGLMLFKLAKNRSCEPLILNARVSLSEHLNTCIPLFPWES